MALALENVSARRARIRTAMRKKYGASWRKNRKAVAEFTRQLKKAGIYLYPGRAASWKKRRGAKPKRSAARRRSGSAKFRAVMKKAASLRKKGLSKRAALKQAWGSAPKTARSTGRKSTAKRKTSTKRKSSGRKLSFRQKLAGFGGKSQMGAKAFLNRARRNGIMLNGLALTNPLALVNRRGRRNPFGGLGVIGTAGAVATSAVALFYLYDYGTPFLQEHVYEYIPIVRDYPNTATGALAGLVLGGTAMGASLLALPKALPMVGSPVAKGLSLALGGAGLLIPAGVGALVDFGIIDPMSLKDKLMAMLPGGSDTGALALENYGGLAMDLGALALENKGYGDGMFFETAPVGADVTSLGYHQASLADAYYSGPDFSVEEGQALLNGASAFANRYGQAPIRTKRTDGDASHLASKPGLRWGWLIKAVGWKRAKDIAALSPKKRLAVLQAMRQAALTEYARQKAARQAADAEVIAAASSVLADNLPSAGGIIGGASGASGASGPGDLGAALFTR